VVGDLELVRAGLLNHDLYGLLIFLDLTAVGTGTANRTGTEFRAGTSTGIRMARRIGTATSRESAALAAAAGRASVMAPAARPVAGPGPARAG